MGKYIPGNPVFVVDNMTGAGGLIGINHVYKVAKPDGLTMATPIGTMFVDQLIGKPGIEFDGRKFEYIGAPAQDTQLLIVHKRTGVEKRRAMARASDAGEIRQHRSRLGQRIDPEDRQRSAQPAAPSSFRLQRQLGDPPGIQQRRSRRRRQCLGVDGFHLAARNSERRRRRLAASRRQAPSRFAQRAAGHRLRQNGHGEKSSSKASSTTSAPPRVPTSSLRARRKRGSRSCAKPSWTP